jgi:hypothetical protein
MWQRSESIVFVFLKDYDLNYIKRNHMITLEDVYPVQHTAGKKLKINSGQILRTGKQQKFELCEL